nr:hypothetical protein [Tanacetum cinerariifolium]
MCEMVCQIVQKKQEEKRIEEEQAANARYWKIPACCDDDDDYDYAITPEETDNSLSMGDEHLDIILETESNEVIKSSVEDLVLIPSEPEGIPDTIMSIEINKKEKLLQLEQLANLSTYPSKCLNSFCYDDDDDKDYTIAVTPILSVEEPDNSLSMGDEHLDTIPATKSDEVIKYSFEDLIPIPSKSEGIPDTMCDVHLVNNPTPLEAKDHFEIVINSNDDYSSSDDDYLYNENIEYDEASPHDSELVSLEVAKIVIPKDEEIKDDNLREKLLKKQEEKRIEKEQAASARYWKIPACCDDDDDYDYAITPEETNNSLSMGDEHLDIIPATESNEVIKSSVEDLVPIPSEPEEISSGSTTTHSDISLPDYEAFSFDDDHIEEISSGKTTTHYDISLSEYDSFIYDFTHEEFADELAHIISPLEYDCFYFWDLPNPVHDSGLIPGLSLLRQHVIIRFVKSRKRTKGLSTTSIAISAYRFCISYPFHQFIIMSNINNNMQTQMSTTLHNAIMEAGSKDRPPMLAPGNYIQWKSRIKRYIDTKPNRELIHYCLMNPLYDLGWKEKSILDAEGNPTNSADK